MLVSKFGELLGDCLEGARLCDIACGEGYLSRFLAQFGPKDVVGIDVSSMLLETARQRSTAANLSFRVDDAQRLGTFADQSVDIAVSQLAVMDIPDHRALFSSVHRILKPGGRFVFSLLHPCFEGPFHLPDEAPVLSDDAGIPIACLARRYTREGLWYSGGDGVRGQMGSYHRTLSTYVNDLLKAGFLLRGLYEPMRQDGKAWGVYAEIPRVLLIDTQAK